MKINNITTLGLCLFALVVGSCSKDNYDAPAAGLQGRILDKETMEPIPQQAINGAKLQLFQTDLSNNATSINSSFHPDGTYNNDVLFDGNYKVVVNGPFFYRDTVHIDIQGQTQHDIVVQAYLHIETEVTEVTANSATVTLTVNRGASNPDQKIARLAAVIGTTNSLDINFFTQRELIDTEPLEDELIENQQQTYVFENLEPNTTYYIRGAARTINTGNYYNYSPVIEITTTGG